MDKYKMHEVTRFKDIKGKRLIVGHTVNVLGFNSDHIGMVTGWNERLVCTNRDDTRVDIKEDTKFIILD